MYIRRRRCLLTSLSSHTLPNTSFSPLAHTQTYLPSQPCPPRNQPTLATHAFLPKTSKPKACSPTRPRPSSSRTTSARPCAMHRPRGFRRWSDTTSVPITRYLAPFEFDWEHSACNVETMTTGCPPLFPSPSDHDAFGPDLRHCGRLTQY